ncbi:DUF2786 domain-containing protein [Escherichia coli]|nr:DUF2786 domain-containing protein [Escherichia coli]
MKDKYIAKIKKLLRLARGTSSPDDVTVNGVKIGTHKHDTPHGISGLPHN